MLTAEQIFTACFYLSLVELVAGIYRKQEATIDPLELYEILNAKEFTKARLHKLDFAKFAFCYDIADQIWTAASDLIRLLVLLFDLIPALWKLVGIICLKIGLTEEAWTEIYLSISMHSCVSYDHLFIVKRTVIEERHGFNREELILSLVIKSPIVATFVWLVKKQSEYNILVTGTCLSVTTFNAYLDLARDRLSEPYMFSIYSSRKSYYYKSTKQSRIMDSNISILSPN
ncbi:Peptidase family M48 containing protein [Trichuris trichiura]|uniref:Peptidase family M48 containing protein n=1 Tax=Trichuris trichiura TaxID=36087 RepID=A0A077Z842_TRITR|nr:Peptidase family M48 containing protein [Trichuris trichiura]